MLTHRQTLTTDRQIDRTDRQTDTHTHTHSLSALTHALHSVYDDRRKESLDILDDTHNKRQRIEEV